MQAPPLARRIRWLFVTILCVTLAAGCAQPDQSDAPDNLHEDGDMDGIPDGTPPQPEMTDGTNETNETDGADANATLG